VTLRARGGTLTSGGRGQHTSRVERARGHQRLLAGLALGLLALTAELAGRSLTHRLDVGRHVGRVSYAHADYYPFLLAAVKVGVALMLARVAWRFARAHAAARAAHRFATALGARQRRRTARVRIELSPRLWMLSFVGTSTIYLVQADAERAAAGHLSLLGPWLHSSALPVFAVLSVLVAILYTAVGCWLADVESLAADAVAYARRLAAPAPPTPPYRLSDSLAPRSRFGLEFESRPPPLSA
jgi:hypothetical protein